MKTSNIFTYIKAAKFFPVYASEILGWKKKMSGKNSNGNVIEFTEQEKETIKAGLNKLFSDLSD